MKIISSSIRLSKVKIFAYHGVLPHEKRVGNEYEIDLELFFPSEEAMTSDNLDKTINYALVYDIIKEEMAIPSELLEHVSYRILNRLEAEFPQVIKASIQLTKVMPPISGFQGDGVTFSAEVEF